MREMVLNHVSLTSPDQYTAIGWLRDVMKGIAVLKLCKVAEPTLRMWNHHAEISCIGTWSLWDALCKLRNVGGRDEYLMFVKLTTKSPLLNDLDQDIEGRFLACEARTIPPPDGDPLVLAAITNGIAVGFPSDATWERSQLVITFEELGSDGSIVEVCEVIDNLTRYAHAEPICQRQRDQLRDNRRIYQNGAGLWRDRREAFPNLVFGLDVEKHLGTLNPRALGIVVNKLASLDESAAKWRDIGGAAPPWGTKVTDESDALKKDRSLRELRRYRSSIGTKELFTWHGRFGNSGRIHLRFHPGSREVEIGYIGNHLKSR